MNLRTLTVAGVIVAGLAGQLLFAEPGQAKTFRFSNDGDVSSMDPYARNETFLLSFMANIYEPLVRRDRNLKLEASLATEWTLTSPTLLRVKLRPNVKWHDGTPFTADDVVFSINRANGPARTSTAISARCRRSRRSTR